MSSAPPPSSGGSSPEHLSVRLYRYRALVRRNWWILVLTLTLGLAYQAWIVHKLPRLYESSSQLNIREEVNESGDQAKFNQAGDAFVGTNVAMLKSPEIVLRAEQRLRVEKPDLTGERPEITSSTLPRSYIFVVTGRGKDPEYTRLFVDAVVAEFTNFRDAQRSMAYGALRGSLSEALKGASDELTASQTKLQEFISQNNVPFWASQAQRSAKNLLDLKDQQASLQTNLQRLETLTPDQLLAAPQQPTRETGKEGGSEAGASFNGDLRASYLHATQELLQAQSRYDERARVWKPKHPKLQALRRQIDEVHGAIALLKQQNRDTIDQQKSSLEADLKIVAASIAAQEGEVMKASAIDAQYRSLEANVDTARKAKEKLQGQEGMYTNGSKLDVFLVLQRATAGSEVPLGALKHLLTGVFGGLALGLGILFLRDQADDRLASSSQLMEQFSEPVLGQIPAVAETRGEAGLPLLQVDDERYSFAEAFRSLRSSLIFMPNQGDLRTLIITSAIPNEGKSTIASNLAITMAAAGASVVVVDADLRRGDLASLFDSDGRTGLSNILRGEVTWESALQTTRYPTLSLIPRGPVTGQSSELLLLPSLDTLLEELKARFDLVIFNTAPILATDDTPTLAPHFDGILMVIRAQFTSARLTKNAMNALYQRQVNVLGMILNCVDTEMPDYYYYRYPKYYAAK